MKIVFVEYKEKGMECGKYVYTKIGNFKGETLKEIQDEIGCSDEEEVSGLDSFSGDSDFGKLISHIQEFRDGHKNELMDAFLFFLEGAYWYGRQAALHEYSKIKKEVGELL